MTRLVYSPESSKDLIDIGRYIARENPGRSVFFVRELRAQCQKIKETPKIYRKRPELGQGIRSCAYGNYMLVFYEEPGLVRVLRILHGAMDIQTWIAKQNG
jgi:toxin ParE1/3/4